MKALFVCAAAVLLAHGAAALTDSECGTALKRLFDPALEEVFTCLRATPADCPMVCKQGLAQIAKNDTACPGKLGQPTVYAPVNVDGQVEGKAGGHSRVGGGAAVPVPPHSSRPCIQAQADGQGDQGHDWGALGLPHSSRSAITLARSCNARRRR